tara:strand:- start:16 stop:525 length:510 start_codon:yes stop_codon:yes gene_type:complete
MNKIIIKDNFLDKDTFNSIKNAIFDCNQNNLFPWFLQDHIGKKGDNEMQLTHVFYLNHVINSSHFKYLKPILEKLKVRASLRIKANVTFKTNKIYLHECHVDFATPKNEAVGKTSLFYFHTTNGPTVFKNGKKVDCVENRMVTFPTNTYHSVSTHTDNLLRGVINFNWF